MRRLNSDEPSVRDKSIGVVSFNSEQQSLIQDLLDQERSKNPAIEWAFAEDSTEPVFVKNLETVQGDERDVIFFSVTYGPDRAGNVYMNFGPLNRDGGERRMNVAITRARAEMVVFSTMHPDKIDLSRTNARAVADLKNFLNYAERGPDALAAAVHGSIGDFESPFESAVAFGLREKGWTVHPQIGVSAFRIDLGVVHPDRPGVYLAGVECDGAMYHSSAYARERDKIRQSVLEGLGWTLFRVWSTDWWINKAQALDALDNRLEEHLEADRAEQARVESKTNDGRGTVVTNSTDDQASRASDAPADDSTGISNWSGTRRVANCASDNTRTHIDKDSSANYAADQGTGHVDDGDKVGASEFRQAVVYVQEKIQVDTGSEQLGNMSPEALVDAVVQVVNVESPVHVDDIIRRVTQGAGLQRAGARIQNVINQAIELAVSRKLVRKKKLFLWRQGPHKPDVRDRSDLPAQDKKLERVSPEEIAVSLLGVVRRNFSLSADDAISEAANDLGFQRVTATMHKQFERILNALITKELLLRDQGVVSTR